ncbi:MAG: acid phosphatase [Flaviaesturariibacter sp.]|nr:acid phosphatase [Flaviaesturariibacter sp.]
MRPRNFSALLLISSFWVLLSCNRNTSPVASMPPTGATGDSLTFLVVGDWGKKGGQSQRAVAAQMNRAILHHGAQFIITTGDNFYYSGVASITDAHWKESFEEVYDQPGHQVPWHPVLGNHDYGKNPQAQIEYSALSKRWQLPARYYSMRRDIKGSKGVLFAFTDTSPLYDRHYAGGMSDLTKQDSAAQLDWLRKALTRSGQSWKIVIGHHPVYSGGPHGNTNELVAKFRPLFRETNTDFYISGHDHSLQHLSVPGEGVQYLVSGGGSEGTRLAKHPFSRFGRAVPGFMIMTLYAGSATIYFYNKAGKLLYRQQVIK